MLHGADGVGRRGGDVRLDLVLGGRPGDIERFEARAALVQRREDVVDELGNVLGVTARGVGIVHVAAGSRDKSTGRRVPVHEDVARREHPRGPVHVERDGAAVGKSLCAGGADGALETGGGAAVVVVDVRPEDGGLAGKGERSGPVSQILVAVGRIRWFILVRIRRHGWAAEFDKGIRVVKEARADGRVVEPGGGRQGGVEGAGLGHGGEGI